MARNGFPGGMGGGNMQQLMRQAQKMQQDMARTQQEISEREFTATVGGGVVSATVLGTKELKAITKYPACVGADDLEMLQDLIISAVNDAIRSADETMTNEMNKITGGMKLGF